MNIWRVAAVLSVVAVLLTMPLVAGPIVIGNPDWYEFSWSGIAAVTGCQPADPAGQLCTASSGGNSQFADAPPWTFTGAAYLIVTDAFASLDRFQVFDNAVSLGLTSDPTPGGSCSSDPAVCLLDPHYSQGMFLLGEGSHSITMSQTLNQFSGAGFFRVDAVPEPTTWLLVGSPLLVFGLLRRRRAARR